MAALDFGGVLDLIWEHLRWDNKHIDEVKPWVLAKGDRKELDKVIYYLLEHLRHIAWMLKPVMPTVSGKMFNQLGIAASEENKAWDEARVWGGMRENATISKGMPLFPRLEDK
jgi:methionyl-tRNA synthetase